MSLGDLETFISEQEKLATSAEPEREGSSVVGKYGSCLVDSGSRKDSQEPGKTSAWGYIIRYFLSLISSVRLACSYI